MATNREEAAGWLENVTTALIDGTTDSITPIAATAGVVHALLDVADAIREQTAALDLGGVRDDLGEIGHAIRKLGSE